MSSGSHNSRPAEVGRSGYVLKVHPIDCAAHGMCAELLPELITLDDWGYPIVDGHELPADLVDLARRAADACPTLAIRLQRQTHAGRSPRS
jgi:ferredoxin